MADDWREKLAKGFGRDVPEEKEEKKDWGAAYEKVESRRPRRGGERSGGYGGGRGNQGGGYGRQGGGYRGQGGYDGRGGYRGQGGGASPRPKTTEPASAPYNFVSLPDAIVPAPLDQGLDWHKMEEKERLRLYRKYVCEDGAKSGRIELSLETLTPLFIGSGNSGDTNEFFSPTGEPIVPGSTLRGFIKHMVRMVSGGAMRPGAEFTERHLYSRALAAEEVHLLPHKQGGLEQGTPPARARKRPQRLPRGQEPRTLRSPRQRTQAQGSGGLHARCRNQLLRPVLLHGGRRRRAALRSRTLLPHPL